MGVWHVMDRDQVLYEAGTRSEGLTELEARERLERYFLREDNTYIIRKEIREMLVFAPQNVIKDPPFTKLDLIICRNLLIYLDVELQRRLLPVFHYALRSGGLLFLGPSESIGGYADLFDTVDSKWKIYRRKESPTAARPPVELLPIQVDRPAEPLPRALTLEGRQSQTAAQVERLLLTRFAPTSLVVDERGTILYIHGRTGAFLEPSEGQPRNNVLEMARPGLAHPLAAAMRQAAGERREVVRENLRVKTNGDYAQFNLAVTWIDEPESIRGLLLVTVAPAPEPERPAKLRRKHREAEQPGRVAELERELQYVKESLQSTIEELETSNEELKSTNEELQSTNEELQSTNEELETSKEEMQSLNEELSTVNTELQAKVEELSRATDDMQNLLNSTQVATVFLDNQLCVKRYTEPAKELFNLIPTDLGRPLAHLTSNVEYDRLIDDCREVLRTLAGKTIEVRGRNGCWHLMRIMPYRTAENVIDGAVLTFVDISQVKEAEQTAAAVCRCFDQIVQVAAGPLAMLDRDLRVVSANRAFAAASQSDLDAMAGKPLFEIGGGKWDLPPLRSLLEEVQGRDTSVAGVKLGHDFPQTGRRVFRVNARRMEQGAGPRTMILLSLEDVTGTEE